MKHLKIFENFNSEIEQICKKITKIPLKFNHISGYFQCNSNKLISLEGAPKSVGGFFACNYNKLTTLEGSPKSVGDDFDCSNNKLTTLKGSAKSVGGNFDCSNNKLTTLKGSPQYVGGNFYCSFNQLTSLEGSPKSVGGNFYCSDNPVYNVWKLISSDNDKWDYGMVDLLKDYDIFRDNKTIVLDRLNGFLEDIGRSTVNRVRSYNLI